MLRIDGDRRRHPRVPVQRPCKIFDPNTGRYHSGTTRDLSTGGLLVDVPQLLDIHPGNGIHVGVAMKRRQGLLLAKEMIEAKVVRTMATVDDHTLLGLAFAEAQSPAVDALRAAA
jgi:c-di-GMP-binding flagellar brake protein YcgR